MLLLAGERQKRRQPTSPTANQRRGALIGGRTTFDPWWRHHHQGGSLLCCHGNSVKSRDLPLYFRRKTAETTTGTSLLEVVCDWPSAHVGGKVADGKRLHQHLLLLVTMETPVGLFPGELHTAD